MRAWTLNYIPGNPDTMRVAEMETPDRYEYVGCLTLERAAGYILAQTLKTPQPLWLAERFAAHFFTERLSHTTLLGERQILDWLWTNIPA
jgi:hypothetical protein